VETTWLPSSVVKSVNPLGHHVFDQLTDHTGPVDALSAEHLATSSPAELRATLSDLCSCYLKWIELQELALSDLPAVHLQAATRNLEACRRVHERMLASALQISEQEDLRHSFQLANFAMHVQHSWDHEKSKQGHLRWRPFQLGFLILSAPSTVLGHHVDRGVMDLLWFPTGGGKTEAYLALIAMLAFYRRIDGRKDATGVSAIMRYTLRLLTTQQFARSAAMIFACDAIRSGRISAPHQSRLAKAPTFSVGLWVGGDSSPNKLSDAWVSLQGSKDTSSPKQLADCPACHSLIAWTQKTVSSPVIAHCENGACALNGALPVWTVDEDVYRERPTLLVGTIDKFAQIVRRVETNELFGVSNRCPPDLIIQDELHLISGPLGTITGSYESAFDLLFSSGGVIPKVIGSTATIRRATEQVRDLFDREACQFPPPALNHDDSGFAVVDPSSTGRRYIGVTTAGRSAKFTLQAVAASLLQSAASAFPDAKSKDPYWTLVGYFNSLRELGGALVLMQDDVTDSIKLFARMRSEHSREMKNVDELTSRRTQEEILRMLGKLAIRVGEPGALDAVLATNMVSVGVDIPRLGLMLVNGQPKTMSEYIQSTSRVGRGKVSGLVVSVLNNAKARDRSHFETFEGWHDALYRDVEATSVTPFASRARDRALHAALVAAVRHLAPGMLNSPKLNKAALTAAYGIIDQIVDRAARIDPSESDVRAELERRLLQWQSRAPTHYWQDYKDSDSLLQSAERAAWKKALGRRAGAAWPTLNSMRSVEAGTPFRMAPSLKAKEKSNGK
jgi:superfamily II DNA or RNA helicase